LELWLGIKHSAGRFEAAVFRSRCCSRVNGDQNVCRALTSSNYLFSVMAQPNLGTSKLQIVNSGYRKRYSIFGGGQMLSQLLIQVPNHVC